MIKPSRVPPANPSDPTSSSTGKTNLACLTSSTTSKAKSSTRTLTKASHQASNITQVFFNNMY